MSEAVKGILIAIAVMVVLGFVLGFIVSLVSTKFKVEEDERQQVIASLLPGANCGACGNPGCEGGIRPRTAQNGRGRGPGVL